jgi:hypothetical protein
LGFVSCSTTLVSLKEVKSSPTISYSIPLCEILPFLSIYNIPLIKGQYPKDIEPASPSG